MSTLLLTPEELARERVEVEGEAYRHLFRAARLAVGDVLRAVDGEGRARHARVVAVDRKRGVVELGEEAPSREATRRVEVFTAVPRPQRAAWLVEKVTELGVAAVRFVATERSARGLGAAPLERLRRVARAAVEQCGRARCPEITGPHPLDALPRLLAGLDERWLLDPAGDWPPGSTAAPPTPRPGGETTPAAFLVGPEGGWTASEHAAALRFGCRPICLGESILRVETACVAGSALLLLPPVV